MADKKKDTTLLGEGTIRRFMTLAGQKALADSFINKTRANLKECGCDLKEEMQEDEPPAEEMDMEKGPEGEEKEEEGSKEELVLQLVDAIASAIEGVSGVEVNVDSSESTPPEPTEMDQENPDEENGMKELQEEKESEKEEHEEEKEEMQENKLAGALKEADLNVVEEKRETPKLKKKNPIQKDHAMKPLKMPKNLKEHKTVLEIATRVATRLLKESKKTSKK